MAQGADEMTSTEDLPRFPATRVFLSKYGLHATSWLALLFGGLFIVVFGMAMHDAIVNKGGPVVYGLIGFGVVTFIAGWLFGVLWSELMEDARKKY